MPSANSIYNYVPSGTDLSYNGYTFPQYRKLTYKCEPIYDDAGRARVGVRYALSVHFLVTSPDEGTSAKTIAEIRCCLTQPGGQLTIEGLGFGDLVVGGATPTKQIEDFGPKPQLLAFEQISGVLAYEAVWEVEFSIVECCGEGQSGSQSQLAGANSIIAWNSATVYSIDDRGLTVRTVTGYVEIPVARVSSSSPVVTTTADAVRDQVNIVLPTGFKLTHQDWRLSEDGRRVEFAVIHTELEGDDFLPPGIVRGSFERSLANRSDMNFFQWTYAINATFERAAGTSRDWAYQKWFLLVATTAQTIQSNLSSPDPGVTSGGGNTGTLMPLRISFATDCFTRVVRMNTSFGLVRSIQDVLGCTGMWQPLNTDYQGWANSMSQQWSNRGNAALYHDPTADSILDPCITGGQTVVRDTQRNYQLLGNNTPVMGCGNITPTTSWLHYQCWTESEKKSYNVVHNPSQKNQQPQDNADDFTTDETSLGKYDTPAYQPIVQSRGAPVTRVWLVGYGVRAKYRPTIPALLTFGGQTCIERERMIDGPRVVGSLPGCDIYAVKWRIGYDLAGIPASDSPILDQPRPWQDPLPGGGGDSI